MTDHSFAFMKTDLMSASASDDSTCLSTLLTIKMAPFVSFFVVFGHVADVKESAISAFGFIF
jgi:hypothetical protein